MPPCHLCISLKASTTEECLAQIAEASPLCDLLEIRLDFIDKPDLPRILSARTRPVIVTNRPAREMGKFHGPETDRIALLETAADLGAAYIDIELDSASRLKRRGKSKLIVSYHNFESTPEDHEAVLGNLIRAGADIPKVATFATRIADNLALFRFLERAPKPIIGLCMGELGKISRILAPRFGSFLTYASLRDGNEAAPGQMPAKVLRDVYRIHRIRPDTEIYGVIGNPVAHSMSPHIHNAAFEALGLNKVYVPFLVNDATEFLREFRRLGVRGYSVTIPHKEAALDSLDEVDSVARKIGAVNTIVERDGKLAGYNTDWSAAVTAIEDGFKMGGETSDSPLRGKRVLIVGAGGAGKAIAFGIKERGGELLIANRTKYRAERLADALGCQAVTLRTLLKDGFDADVVVNASSVGMHPHEDETPVPKQLLKPGTLVFDAVYNPISTRLLREASEIGCRTVTGFEMFIRQAVSQFELWTGHQAPRDLMAQVVRQRLETHL